MDHRTFDQPHLGLFLTHFRQEQAQQASLSAQVEQALALMQEEGFNTTDRTQIAQALGGIYHTLDQNYLGKRHVSADLVSKCWHAWLDTSIYEQADPWMACLVNLLHAYGANMEEDVSDPTGVSSTFRKLFLQDEALGPYMQLDRSAFMRGVLESATPKATGVAWRRSL
jgi:hypothetical protein